MLNIIAERDLAASIVGRVLSSVGDGVALVALTLRMQSDGARPYAVGLLLSAGVVPQPLLAPWVGRMVDAHDSRRLLVGGGTVAGVTTVPLIFLHSLPAIVLLAAVLGSAGSLTTATWTALIPRIVGEDRLARAVGAQQSVSLLALVGAPAVGALLTSAFGSAVPIILDAASFVIMTGAASLIRTRRAPPASPPTGRSAHPLGGAAILRADRLLAPLLAGVAVVILLVGMVDVVLVYLVRDTLHAAPVWYGIVEASWVAGMVIGSIAASRIATAPGQVRATTTGAALACAATLAFAAAHTAWPLVPLSLIGGVGNGGAGVCLSTLLMTRTEDGVRGRVSATAGAILGGTQGASLLLGGAVAIALAPRTMYAVGGLLGLAATGVLALLSPSGSARATTSADFPPS